MASSMVRHMCLSIFFFFKEKPVVSNMLSDHRVDDGRLLFLVYKPITLTHRGKGIETDILQS